MNSPKIPDHRRSVRGRETEGKLRKQRIMPEWRRILRRHQPAHDPMLVFNMSIFNFTDGWNRTFNPQKVHENGT